MIWRASLNKLIGLGLAAALAGCGSKVDPGANITVNVKPDNDVLIGPGPLASCIGYALGVRNVSGPVLRFNSFIVKWDSADTLYVQGIRYTVQGAGIAGGTIQGTLGADEVALLVGYTEGVIPQGKGPGLVIVSSDPARLGTGQIPCGLVLGNLHLTKGDQTPSFRANVRIELIGSAEDSSQNLRLVRQHYDATAFYYGP